MYRPVTRCLRAIALLAIGLGFPAPAHAQIPVEEYLKYMPLTYPRIVRQTEASARFRLYGNPADPSYRDAAPRDGIDDARAAWLQALAERFAPIMVRNTPQFPMDFRAFYGKESFPLFVERWDIARARFSLVDSDRIDLARLRDKPCPPGGDPANDDCRLLALIEKFGPNRRPLEPEAAARPEQETFSVMHLDLPGFDEKTWKENYWAVGAGTKNPALAGSERVFAHPFIAEVAAKDGGVPGYELVIQYWFFYPANDGPNNHEGDWEHINVIVAPLSGVGRPFDAATLERLLSGRAALDGQDPVVIRRIEYYLHHFVYAMDFASPSVYQPRDAWDREVKALAHARKVNRGLWDRIRERAYRDPGEAAINTRPVVWIGGDAVGFQNVLEMPGLRDQDGHASYPFRGYYRRIGPGGVAERAIEAFDHFEYFAGTKPAPKAVEDYGQAGRVALMPDWEVLMDPILTDPGARRDWSWMLLPMRFGYPASPSPAAGLSNHSDMGNVAPVGPTFNNAWNRVGDSAGYDVYDMVEESWAVPLGPMDSFFPRAGFLNAPILYFMIKPPLDLLWRTVSLPVRAAAGSTNPTFLPANAPAIRNISVEAGPMLTNLPDDLAALFLSREQLPEILVRIAIALPPDAGEVTFVPKFGWTTTPVYSVVFHLSPRFSTESSVISYRAPVGFDATAPGLAAPIETRANFEQFEYHGAFRFNLMTGSVQPYVKYGHGITWYRLEDVAVDGIPLSQPTSPKYRPEAGWSSLGFNETILGGGIDWSRIRVGKAWLGVKASYTWIHHDLGFERQADVEDFPTLATALAGTTFSIWRQQARVLISIGF